MVGLVFMEKVGNKNGSGHQSHSEEENVGRAGACSAKTHSGKVMEVCILKRSMLETHFSAIFVKRMI